MSDRAQRRKLEREVKKGKKITSPVQELLYNLKYSYDDENKQRTILDSLGEKLFNSINGDPLPKSYIELGATGHTYSNNDIIKEIKWYTYNFKKNYEKVNEFLSVESQVYSNILSGKYSEARNVLAYIDLDICVSHWSIEQSLIIAEYEIGFKKNKETLANIINPKNQDLTNLFAKYQSVRVEKNLSFFTYEEIVAPYIKKHSSQIQDLLNYKLNFFKSDIYNNAGLILSFLNGFSIIDNYSLFINVIGLIISKRTTNLIEIEAIKTSLLELRPLIDDVRINNYLISLGVIDNIDLSQENIDYLEILDFYTEGRYDEVINLSKDFLLNNSECFDIYELYIKSLINLGLAFENFFAEDSIAYNSLRDLNNIIRKNSHYQESIINIYKTFNSLGLNSWTFRYFNYFNNEHSTYNHDIDVQKLSMLYCKCYNPAECTYLEKDSLEFLNKLNKSYSSKTAVFWKNVVIKLYDFDEKVPEHQAATYRETFYDIKIIEVKKDYETALMLYTELENNLDFIYEVALPHNYEELLHAKLKCLLNLEKFNDAVNLTVESLFKNKFLNNRLCSKYLIDKITLFENEDCLKNISSSILLHQYLYLIQENDLWVSYDEFMSNQNIAYPKELEKTAKKFDKDKLIYFLKNICRQDVYDSSPNFESQDELDNERVEVCRLLSLLDKDNFELYINEIADINRNQLIRRGIKQIDESKIYVDVNGIKISLDKDIRESFDRSLNLLNLPLDQIQKLDESSERVLVPYYSKDSDQKADSTLKIKLSSYSRFSQFIDMFSKIRDKFIASNEFGIDTYLSMRIRHGTLLGEIRSVFELYNLVTKKEDNSNQYQSNAFLKDKLQIESYIIEKEFDLIMSNFSAKIDNICNDLKNNKIQIKTERKNVDGLFDYTFKDSDLVQIYKHQIGDITIYEEFFDTVISLLWDRTEKILHNIRENISSSIKTVMIQHLSELGRNLEAVIDKSQYPELNEIISNITSCQTEISNELDKISSWFKRSNSKSINEFDIDLPIDASLTILKRIYKEYNNLQPDMEIDCPMKFEGENFPDFTYIMQNLFHNILTHSKLSSKELKINISATLNENILSICIANNFSESLDLSQINQKIIDTRALLEGTHDNEKTRAEDGTGYIKIRKTIVTDLNRKNYSIKIADVNEKRIFKTLISFEVDKLEKVIYPE